jgi:hypothetical protein
MIQTTGRRLALTALLLTYASGLAAEVSRIEIVRRETLSSQQTSVRYEALFGTLYFTLDPAAPGNQMVHDIALAPVNADGLVEFSTDFKLLVPDRAIASDALLYHVNNRGGSRLPPEISLTHPLTGLGYTYLVTGWINELTPGEDRYRLHAPIVGTAAEPVTGQVRYEIIVGSAGNDESINGEGHLAYTPTAAGLLNATLTARLNQGDPRVPVPREDFTLNVNAVEGANQPLVTLNLKGGLQPGMIYELIYEAQDPVLGGAGMAGIRDMVSLLRYGADDIALTTQVAELGLPALEHSITWGNSQSGRLLRLFLYEGFNADLDGRRVFDGVMPVIAGAGYGMFNNRFAMPTRTNGQHENQLYPNDYFPFTYGDSTDPYTGRTEGVLTRARSTDTEPKVMHIQTSNEYWIRGGSLPHTDPLGQSDAVIPDNVRFYAIGGSQHGSGSGRPGAPSGGQLPNNPNMWTPFADSLLVAMVNWVKDEALPPPSVYPKIADGTLVPAHLPDGAINPAAWNPLPGVRHPKAMYKVGYANFGEHFLSQGIVDNHPTATNQFYEPMVPRVGRDNNDQPGNTLLPALAAVPLGTFVPWNLRSTASGADTELARLAGGYVPFPRTPEEATASKDPRIAISDLYSGFEDYLRRYEAATDELIRKGYLLPAFKETLMAIARGNQGSF